ncbi:MAG: DNA-directed DNA polymerase II small subunit [Candidatus Micrarchaeota archaeon]
MKRLADRGIRVSIDAELLLKDNEPKADELIIKLLSLNKMFITRDDVDAALAQLAPPQVELRSSDFIAEAREHAGDIRILHQYDVTGKSRTRGEVDNFVNYFRNRYERMSRMMRNVARDVPTVTLSDAKKHVGDKVRVIVMITDKRKTKKGNLFFEIEDMSDSFKVVFSGETQKKAAQICLDDVVAISGKVLEPYLIANDVEWPDVPVTNTKKLAEKDLAVAYISDIHFGSNKFMQSSLDRFVKWLHGDGDESVRKIASKVKYVVIAGDLVDGIGIYPKQERELVVKDIYKQYEMFNDFIAELPDYIEVIIGPGNHDAVRRGDPMPAIADEYVKADVTSIGSPSFAVIEGVKHLVYHGTSIDSFVANIPGLTYTQPEKVMIEYVKRRHLSPIYGGNLIIPENIDYMVLEELPDVIHCGHVHKNSYAQYRGIVMINSGTFQSRTEYQVKQGHVPTPGFVPVYELKYGRLRTMDFSG